MWGNLHGWLISAVLAVVILAPVAWLADLSRMSSPTGIGLDPANFMALELPVSPDEAWPTAAPPIAATPIAPNALPANAAGNAAAAAGAGTSAAPLAASPAPAATSPDGSAADLYRQVIDEWDTDAEGKCRQFVQSPGDQLPQPMRLLIQAVQYQRMDLFTRNMPALINYQSDHPSLEKLFAAGEWACKVGLSLHQHGQTLEARQCTQAAFALGRQLARERIVFDEYQKGAVLMADAGTAMCGMVPHGSQLYDQLTEFEKGLEDYQNRRVIPMWQTISNVAPDVIARSAGDILAIAERSNERMWRVEATLALGRYQYNAGTRGDQIGASHAVRRLAADPDPAVAIAAAAARDLTLQTYRMIH